MNIQENPPTDVKMLLKDESQGKIVIGVVVAVSAMLISGMMFLGCDDSSEAPSKAIKKSEIKSKITETGKLRSLEQTTSSAITDSVDVQYKSVEKKGNEKLLIAGTSYTLESGQWVQLEGILQKDKTVLCTEVKILTGDFQDDDWEFVGIVGNVDSKKKKFQLSGVQVQVQADAEYETDEGIFKSFSDIKPGMMLEVEGVSPQNGIFMAVEIEDITAELKEEPEKRNEMEIEGKIGSVDAKKQTITISGIVFQLTEQTKAKSVVK